MTNYDKERIIKLRQQGLGFTEISKELNIKSSSIRSYCSRNSIAPAVCPQCGIAVFQTPHRKAKRFCSAKCRMNWWNHHTDWENKNPHHTQVCPVCNKTFKCFKAKPRKYCSRSCYAQARRRVANNNG